MIGNNSAPASASALDAGLTALEEARLRRAYAHRSDGDLYSWFNAAHLYAMQEIERELLRGLHRHGFQALAQQRVLEIGCGSAVWLREFVKWGAQPGRLAGVDLLDERITHARTVCPAGFRLAAGSATTLDFSDGAFDIVIQSLVFTSILDRGVRHRVAAEMLRVVRPGGLVVWYDYHFDNPWNPDTRGVPAREIPRLFPGCRIERQRITLAPPLARAIARRSRVAYAILSAVPVLKTHYLAFIRTRQPAAIEPVSSTPVN